jgi:hypothetical protein
MSGAATTTVAAPGEGRTGRQFVFLGAFVSSIALLLYSIPLVRPVLVVDDFQILAASWTWDATVQNLWVPNNEHAMPLGRAITWLVVSLSGNMACLPFVAGLQGVLALLLAMWLVYLFAKRELGHPFFGLVAMALFGVTTIYQQAVYWFAASFSLLALGTLFLGLLAAQSWLRSGRWHHIWLAALCAFLAPMWFASGVLAGPLLSLYLLLTPSNQSEVSATARPSRFWASLPLLGTVAFLAISLPLTAQQIMHLEHYDGQTAIQAFMPLQGLLYTGRSIVENLVLGTFGISGVTLPLLVDLGLLAALCLLLLPWWRGAPRSGLLWLGLAFILLPYLLTYSARGTWDWEKARFTEPRWSRYHLFPQFGIVLLLLTALPRLRHRFGELPADGSLTSRQRRIVVVLALALFLINAPRGIAAGWHAFEDYDLQHPQLVWIDRIEDLCRERRISADAVRQELGQRGPFRLGPPQMDMLTFLRGSPDPLPLSGEEVRAAIYGYD